MKINTKLLWRATAGIAVFLILGIAAVFVIVNSDRFRQFLLDEIVRKSEAATGAKLKIARLGIDWRLLQLDLYGVELRGTEKVTEPPLFAADHLRVGLKIISILDRKINLKEIVLDQPVVHFRVAANGNTNLPRTSSQPSGSVTVASTVSDILELAIRHVQINSGQVFYNDDEVPFSAELRDFRAQISFNLIAHDYHVDLAYEDGRVTAKDLMPIAHRLKLNFTLARLGIVIDPIVIMTAKSSLTAHAKVAIDREAAISGSYEAAVSATEVRQIAGNTSIPYGDVALNGNFSYQNLANKSWLDALILDGHLSSQQLTEDLGRKTATAKSISGEFRLQGGGLNVRNMEADLLGGRFSGNYQMLHVSGNSSSGLDALLKNVSLEQINDKAAAQHLKSVRLVGSVNGTIAASWTSRIQDGVTRMRLAIRSPRSAGASSGSSIPIDGVIDLTYDGARNSASFGKTYLRTGNTTATVQGTLSKQSRLDTELNTADLHEVVGLVSLFESPGSPEPIASWTSDLQGSAHFKGQVLGSVKDPGIKGELSANNLVARQSRWRSLQVNVDAGSSTISLENGSLFDTQKGQIAFSARAGLGNWSLNPSSPIMLRLSAKQISVAELWQFTKQDYPVTGMVAANISIDGSQEHPQGQGSLQLTQASAWNQPINNFIIDFKGDGTAIHSNAKVSASPGTLAADVTYSVPLKSYEATLQSPGIDLSQLQTGPVRDLNLTGIVSITASGHGTWTDPQLEAKLQIPQLTIRDQSVSNVQAQIAVANRHANFTLNSNADQGSIQAKGDVGLDGEYPASASLDVRQIPVAVVLASYFHTNTKVKGDAELHATLKGPLKNPAAIVADVEMPKLSLSYESTSLALVSPLRMNYRDGLATLEEAEFKGTGTELHLKGTIPVKSPVPLNISANGTVDLSIVQAFSEDVRSSGHIELNVSARGDLAHPAMQGQIHLVNATASSGAIPVGLEGINGLIQISGNRIEIAQFSGAAGGGTVSAHGFMTYGEPSNFNLGLDLKSVRLRYPEGLRSILSGDLALSGAGTGSQMTGHILVDRISFTQQFDLATVLGQFSAPTSAESPSALERNMKLNVAVSTAQDLNVANNKLSMGGAANLTLVGTVANPVVLGRTTLTGGEMFFMGKRYEIQSGTIEFANPVRTTPILNLYVTTSVQQYNLTLNFVGPANRLRTNYTSDPPLPPADIINLIAFGQTSEQSASSPSTPASLGAESVLAQGVAGQVSNKIERLTGISQLTIDPLASNSQTNPGSTVAIQERVTGNILLTFSTDVTTTQSQAIQLQYKVKKNLSISVLRDEYGGYAAGVRVHKTF